jgi:diguanylate cyclase (GGDEF)-like protein
MEAANRAHVFPKTLLARLRQRLARSVRYDSLTGLPNRSLIYDRIEHALETPWRLDRQLALFFLDLDRFKTINDSLGHAVGDQVLAAVAGRLERAVGPDTAGRMGGDEFVVFSERMTPALAAELAERLLHTLRQPLRIGDRELLVTASIGYALADPDSRAAELLGAADTAMHRVKHSGRDATAPFTPAMRLATGRRTDIETRLRRAIGGRDMRLHYQPLFHISGQVVGFEALARWSSPQLGVVAPDEFIPVIEELGLIEPFTSWALDVSLGDLARWRRVKGGSRLTMSVNISATQMSARRLDAAVGVALSSHGLPADALCLEITEGALVAHEAVNRECLEDLNRRGVRLSIDDFGTGFSSLAYLARLPVDELKIDQAFVNGMLGQENYLTVITSIIELAHQLGMAALAEGVETDAQLSVLRRLGCDFVQGFLTARPTMSEEIDLRLPAMLSLSPPPL